MSKTPRSIPRVKIQFCRPGSGQTECHLQINQQGKFTANGCGVKMFKHMRWLANWFNKVRSLA